MAQLIIALPDPLGLASTTAEGNGSDEYSSAGAGETPTTSGALLLGAQVEVTLTGHSLTQVFEVPRSLLRGERSLWVFDPLGPLPLEGTQEGFVGAPSLGRLRKREVEILRRRPESVLVRAGVRAEELIIASRLATPVEGMRLTLSGGVPR